jgi:alkanesulfonate monooxygenase SsuD/methylene tetrahydromethanopterin reductase-like flavin-dependent oxidoreductase (luciferase family)
LEEFIKKRSILQTHCQAIGRDEDTIRKTISSEVFIRETEKEIIEAGSKNLWGESAESWRSKALVGTPEQVSEKIQKYLDAGCTGFIPWCPDYPSTETLELFAKKVIPHFR